MKTIHHVYAIFGLGIVLAGVSVANPAATKQTKPTTQPVVVTNTAANPVKVEVQGTPSVNVSGTVNIGNPGGSPVPVRDVDASGRAPFNFFTGFQLGATDIFKTTTNPVYTVPAGKRLVLETVMMQSFLMPPGQRMTEMGITGGFQIPFAVHDNGTDFNGNPHFIVNFTGKLQFAAGTEIKLYAGRDASDSTVVGIEVLLSGYLETVPSS